MKIRSQLKLDPKKIPAHVAIIMDGNRRWAAKHGLGPVDGHCQAAQEAIEPLIKAAIGLGIKYLTLWAWSTENWRRDKIEVNGIMKLFSNGLKDNLERFQKMGVRLNYLGDLSRFSKAISRRVLNLVKKSKENKVITVTFALNYGGRDEILRAVKRLIKTGRKVSEIDENLFASCLDTAGMPDPDLVIRTGGANRLSGFLPWQAVYSEFYFTPVLMPDFTPGKLKKAIASFQKRERRFGGGSFSVYRKNKG
ncbi:MAG: di-trans,poly-cis-decaprenylcistransferase [Candidatus Pacebacteria bacterium]|nr:di-trans,poly-cis-decaprenylcistransferase [Candidatus Paceibacterota bacterium]